MRDGLAAALLAHTDMDTGGAVNRAELRQILDQEAFDPASYSLDDGLADDTFCLGRRHKKWVVYYSEKGSRWNEHRFETEQDACQYFLARMREVREIVEHARET
jgi:hypothetical protein